MKTIGEAFLRFFRKEYGLEKLKMTVKTAIKNVWYNKTKYIYFVIFFLMIQSLLSCVILFNHNNNLNEIRYLEDEYVTERGDRYHLVMNNLTANQRADVLNYYASFQEVDRYFTPVWQEQVKVNNNIRHNIYIYFDRPVERDTTPYQLYQRFLSAKTLFNEDFGMPDMQQTPYLLAYRSQVVNNTLTTVLVLVITAIGVLMFAILFNTVVNHFKFSYGVYMTFGANFKKLILNAVSEMLVINVITFIPSFLLSLFITFLLTRRSGYGLAVLIYPMFLALALSVVLTVIAVFLVMKRLSVQTPDKLIRSVNNVGLITSPRFSKRLPQSGYPVRSELLTLKRFVKYIVTLALSTLIFAGVFVGGIYLMQAQTAKEAIDKPQFSLSFPTGGILQGDLPETTANTTGTTEPEESDEEEEPPILEYPQGYTYIPAVREQFYAIDGVRYIVKDRGVAASVLTSHILLEKDDMTFTLRNQGFKTKQGMYAYENLDYKLVDEEVFDNIRFQGGTITGDINAVLQSANTVAISDSYNNQRSLKLEVGDTIRVSTSFRRKRRPNYSDLITHKEFLEERFRCYTFGYTELTVGAIISDLPCEETIPIYMNADTFEAVTKQKAYFADVSIYCDEGLSESEIQEIQRRLYNYKVYYQMSVTNTSQDTLRTVEYQKNYPGIILYVSLLLLMASVLIMFLNQTLFYQMRKQELDIYLCLGSNFKRLKKLFLVDGIFFSCLAAIGYSLFAFLSSAVVFRYVNSSFGGAEIRYVFSLPLEAYLFGLLITVGAAFLSVMLSYLTFKKRSAPVFTGKAVAVLSDEAESQSSVFDSEVQ